jgi:hypothetical protein
VERCPVDSTVVPLQHVLDNSITATKQVRVHLLRVEKRTSG